MTSVLIFSTILTVFSNMIIVLICPSILTVFFDMTSLLRKVWRYQRGNQKL
jgi:hypothetical protein